MDDRINQIIEILIQLAQKNFEARLHVSGTLDEIDSIMLAVNMLGEELKSNAEKIEQGERLVEQTSKLAFLGEMSSGLSHELNNPLFLLMGFLDLARRNLIKDHPQAYESVRTHLDEVFIGAERMRKIINQMRDFSRQSTNTLERVDLNQVIQDSFILFREHLKNKNISVQFDLSERELAIMADKIKLEQVFVNLIANARDAIELKNGEGGGKIVVASHLDKEFATIQFSDDGCGMDEETRGRLYDAFFTTKEIGKGTGLGMSVSYGILKSFNSLIYCDSTPGEGTRFTIKIPLAEIQSTIHENSPH